MKVGIIAPIKLLEDYCTTTIQYCLPSLLVGNQSYKAFYIRRRMKGDTIILDCRKLGWKRMPEDFDIITESLKLVQPDIIIAPSFMFNYTYSSVIFEAFVSRFSSFNKKIIRCLEGTSESAVPIFLEDKVVAIPSHMYRYITNIKTNPNTIFIENHLSIEELKDRQGILVTSLPVRLGLQGRLLADYRPAPNSLSFYEEEDKYPTIVKRNIEDTLDFYEEEQ